MVVVKGVHFLVSPLIFEPINVLRVTLRESKRHKGAYEVNDPTHNSGLSDIVDDWGLRTNVPIHRALYTQYKGEKPPSIYMVKRKTVNGWGIERVVLGANEDQNAVSWLCLSRLSRWKKRKA
ncbi:hypothetical protein PIB30_068946 [Stylosanthes scabra]|uniref:Uncharacterized protein n=1 Tax=Stylosanthes scabra TaxID=79078 RepID=A0ABU6YNT2_9FABA|nr:hypothetical protein [Stylosanthes scabra]